MSLGELLKLFRGLTIFENLIDPKYASLLENFAQTIRHREDKISANMWISITEICHQNSNLSELGQYAKEMFKNKFDMETLKSFYEPDLDQEKGSGRPGIKNLKRTITSTKAYDEIK